MSFLKILFISISSLLFFSAAYCVLEYGPQFPFIHPVYTLGFAVSNWCLVIPNLLLVSIFWWFYGDRLRTNTRRGLFVLSGVVVGLLIVGLCSIDGWPEQKRMFCNLAFGGASAGGFVTAMIIYMKQNAAS